MSAFDPLSYNDSESDVEAKGLSDEEDAKSESETNSVSVLETKSDVATISVMDSNSNTKRQHE